jgi:hypothetical protein
MAAEDVRPGMTGSGLSVVEGRTPERFDVRVLGVIPNPYTPDLDIVIVEASGSIIEKAGGIWYGMSGSPVYIGGKLVGAVAYGFGSTSPIAGLTAAEDMLRVLEFSSASALDIQTANRPIHLPKSLRAEILRRGVVPAAEIDEGMGQLKLPFVVSGLSQRAMTDLRRVVESEELPLLPFSGGTASSGLASSADRLDPGDSFAATISYGDVTSAGIGTTTAVCGDQALAFGHSFFHHGGTLRLGANHASTLAVINDFWGPYKFASVAEGIGVMDQDRLAGIRATLGESPRLTRITSSMEATNTGRSRDGLTEVTHRDFVPWTALEHVYSNVHGLFDEDNPGTATLGWRVTGTTESGGTWELVRSNIYSSEYDISYEVGFELLGQLFTLLNNNFEEIEFDEISLESRIDAGANLYTIKKALVSLNGGDYISRRRISVRRGDVVGIRALLEDPEDASQKTSVDLRIRVPRGVRGSATIQVEGGGSGDLNYPCFFFGENCASDESVDSLGELISVLENGPTNDQVIAKLVKGRNRVRAQDVKTVAKVVQGRKRIRTSVR